ncbi:L-type lectin-domain containing receptor kinase IV.2, partial [Bienertia sinuspersici]
MASYPKMEGDYQEKEMELVLKLGILCLHPTAKERPTMRQVTWFLSGSENLPDIPSEYDYDTGSRCFFREFWVESSSLPSSGYVSLGIMSSTNSKREILKRNEPKMEGRYQEAEARPTMSQGFYKLRSMFLYLGCSYLRWVMEGDLSDNVAEDLFLSDSVYDCWQREDILMASDPKMKGDYQEKEMELVLNLVVLAVVAEAIAQNETQFSYNGFQGSINKLHLGGLAKILPNGVLEMSDYWPSDAYYPDDIVFESNRLSFSTTFVFAMPPPLIPYQSSNGIIFIITSSFDFQQIPSHNCLSSSNVFAVVLGATRKADKEDIDGNHVEIYESCDKPADTAIAAYYSEGVNRTLLLNSGKSMQIWIDYDEVDMMLNVTLAHLGLQSLKGWSWNQSGKAHDLDPFKLPKIPLIKHQKKSLSLLILVVLLVVLLLSLIIMIMIMIIAAVWLVRRKKYKELVEPWEKVYTPNRFSYKDLSIATKDFQASKILGVGGFGKVYKGILPSTGDQIAVKRISHNSKQGMKEFVAEISSMRRLRHRNLVPLLGYCRRKGELLLVYEYMQNGSLEKFLYGKDDKSSLRWSLRFKIIKGVASALLYLHEGCKQVILHRDVKASNVLLDVDMNARLTTHVVGTIGYIAPEVCKTRKPNTSTDVYAFGMFLLEVACGRRPTGKQDADDDAKALFLSDWVYECWKRGDILKASDSKLEGVYQENEMELILKLGLVCLHPKAEARPSMRQVDQFLDGSALLPEMSYESDPKVRDFFVEMQPLTSSYLAVLSSTNSVLHYAIWFLWRKKYEELLEPWEKEFSPHRFSFKDLSLETKGFKNSELLGVGGFGRVYKGVLPSTGNHVAVKRVSHDSKQGMKEFVAEISSMRRLRHRNMARLLGYCRRKGELLLVYEYMSNGSLDKLIYGKDDKSILCWSSRFKIIKGVASALLYLHEEWELVVLHCDIKASNVLLDADMNVRLGDFGVARLYDHNNGPRTTHVVGTIGYIAPEVNRMQRPTTRSD